MPKFIVEAIEDGVVTLKTPNNNYRNSFKLADGVTLTHGQRVTGTIHAPAWKVDHVELGGNYVEPLFGRPRRMQGTILSIHTDTNELTVLTAYEVTVKLPSLYQVANYAAGTRIAWDNIDVPVFELAEKPAEVHA